MYVQTIVGQNETFNVDGNGVGTNGGDLDGYSTDALITLPRKLSIDHADDHLYFVGKNGMVKQVKLENLQVTTIAAYNSAAEFTEGSVFEGNFVKPISVSVAADNTAFFLDVGAKALISHSLSCNGCPSNSHTDLAGKTKLEDCLCDPGYTGPDGGHCVPCGLTEYKESRGSAACSTCIPNSKTFYKAATSPFDCKCLPGFVLNNESTCALCDAGFYCEGDTNIEQCPSGSTSNSGASNINDCFCRPGFTGPNGQPCTYCSDGFYKPTSGSSSCLACGQFGRTNFESGRDDVSDCVCGFGATLVNETAPYETQECRLCNTGRYKDFIGDEKCLSCVNHTYTTELSGRDNITDCICLAGFGGNGAELCTICDIGFYNDATNTECDACPFGSSTDEKGNDEITDCRCNPGKFGPNGEPCNLCAVGSFKALPGPQNCSLCPVNTFQDLTGQASCQTCRENSTSLIGSTEWTDCVCDPGFFTVAYKTCGVCLPNHYCIGDEIFKCPNNSSSPSGSDDITDCVCDPGFVGENGEVCNLCPIGSYCEGGNHVELCPANTTTDPGQDDVQDCLCRNGMQGPPTGPCEVCPKDTFCFDGSLYLCPANSSAPKDSGEITDCVCDPTFVGPNGGTCELCPSNSYCPGGETAIPCPLNSSSLPGSNLLLQCKCDPGFEGSDGGPCVSCTGEHEGEFDRIVNIAHYCTHNEGSCDYDVIAPGGKAYFVEIPQCGTLQESWMKDEVCQPLFATEGDCVTSSHTKVYSVGYDDHTGATLWVIDMKKSNLILQQTTDVCDLSNAIVATTDDYSGLSPLNIMDGTFCDTNTDNLITCTTASEGVDVFENRTARYVLFGIDNDSKVKGFEVIVNLRPTEQRYRYCKGGQANFCQRFARSEDHSDELTDCLCIPGYFGEPGQRCHICPENHYCVGGDMQVSECPDEHQISQRGGSELSDCVCEPGYFGVDGTTCSICPGTVDGVSSFCPGGNVKTDCPSNSAADVGAKDVSECLCTVGFSSQENGICSPCPENSFCPGLGVQTSCPANTVSPLGSDSLDDCICATGHFGEDGNECVPCEAGFYKDVTGNSDCQECPNNTYNENLGSPSVNSCQQCPEFSVSDPGSITVSDCLCDPGKTMNDIGICVNCPTGTFKTQQGNEACDLCPLGTFSDVEGLSSSDLCQTCPSLTEAFPGATSRTDCLCIAGYFGNVDQGCQKCQAGTYAPDPLIAHEIYNLHDENQVISVDGLHMNHEHCQNHRITSSSEPENGFCLSSSSHIPNGYIEFRFSSNYLLAEILIRGKSQNYFGSAGYVTSFKIATPVIDGEGQESWQYAQCFYQDCIFTANIDMTTVKTIPLPDNFRTSALRIYPITFYKQPSMFVEVTAFTEYYHREQLTETSCLPCPVNTYSEFEGLTHKQFCLACPLRTVSLEGSDQKTDCTCDAGYTASEPGVDCTACAKGSFKSDIGSVPCTLCSNDHYGTETAATDVSVCQSCPEHALSDPGSDHLHDCECVYPFTVDVDDGNERTCKNCTVCTEVELELRPCNGTHDTICVPAGCLACPENTLSPEGNFDVNNCICKKGFFGEDGKACNSCPEHTYKDVTGDSLCIQCPENSISPSESILQEACQCVYGYSGPAGGPCQEGCNTGENLWLNFNVTNFKDICVDLSRFGCEDGWNANISAYIEIDLYDIHHVSRITTQGHGSLPYWSNTYSIMISNDTQTWTQLACTPRDNKYTETDLYGVETEEICVSSHKFDANTNQDTEIHHNFGYQNAVFQFMRLYPLHENRDENLMEIPSLAGIRFGLSTWPCVPCATGFYKVDSHSIDRCDTCPFGSTTASRGSDELTDCTCKAGYIGNNGLECDTCSPGTYKEGLGPGVCQDCPKDTYQPVYAAYSQQLCLGCPDDSSTVGTGSDERTDCICNGGFEGEFGGPCSACATGKYRTYGMTTTCNLCPENTFNPLTQQDHIDDCQSCPEFQNSPAGSDESIDCQCIPGYTGNNGEGCNACNAGHYKEVLGDSDCIACPEATFLGEEAATNRTQCVSCPQNTNSALASTIITDCIAIPGYYGYDGTDAQPCPQGTFKSVFQSFPNKGLSGTYVVQQSILFFPFETGYADVNGVFDFTYSEEEFDHHQYTEEGLVRHGSSALKSAYYGYYGYGGTDSSHEYLDDLLNMEDFSIGFWILLQEEAAGGDWIPVYHATEVTYFNIFVLSRGHRGGRYTMDMLQVAVQYPRNNTDQELNLRFYMKRNGNEVLEAFVYDGLDKNLYTWQHVMWTVSSSEGWKVYIDNDLKPMYQSDGQISTLNSEGYGWSLSQYSIDRLDIYFHDQPAAHSLFPLSAHGGYGIGASLDHLQIANTVLDSTQVSLSYRGYVSAVDGGTEVTIGSASTGPVIVQQSKVFFPFDTQNGDVNGIFLFTENDFFDAVHKHEDSNMIKHGEAALKPKLMGSGGASGSESSNPYTLDLLQMENFTVGFWIKLQKEVWSQGIGEDPLVVHDDDSYGSSFNIVTMTRDNSGITDKLQIMFQYPRDTPSRQASFHLKMTRNGNEVLEAFVNDGIDENLLTWHHIIWTVSKTEGWKVYLDNDLKTLYDSAGQTLSLTGPGYEWTKLPTNENSKLDIYFHSLPFTIMFSYTHGQWGIHGSLDHLQIADTYFDADQVTISYEGYVTANEGGMELNSSIASRLNLIAQTDTSAPSLSVKSPISLCVLCPEGTFSTSTAATNISTCESCPPNSHSHQGSNNIAECVCDPGFTGPNGGPCVPCDVGTYKDVNGSATCSLCPQGTYNPLTAQDDVSDCLSCALNSDSSPGSSLQEHCLCNPGFTGPDGGECVACVAGTFKPENGSSACTLCKNNHYSTETAASDESTCLQCPLHTESEAGSNEKTDCICLPGFTGPDGEICTACSAGTYKVTSGSAECTECGVDTFSTTINATSPTTCLACPLNTESLVGSPDIYSCQCSPGFSNPDNSNGQTCFECEAGTFKTDKGPQDCTACASNTYNTLTGQSTNTCVSCPTFTISLPGSSIITDCVCQPGYTGNDGQVCAACVAGSYKEVNGSTPCVQCGAATYSTVVASNSEENCESCPSNTNSLLGSDQIEDCFCNPGFTSTENGTPCTACAEGKFKSEDGPVECTVCPSGTYLNTTANDALTDCNPCPDNTNSLEGNPVIEGCICDAGYSSDGNDHSYQCYGCPGGTFKDINGSSACQTCSDFSTSGTAALHCYCISGYYSEENTNVPCFPCSAGTYNPLTAQHECQLCPINSLSDEASQFITDCQCIPGYHGPNGGLCAECPTATFKPLRGPHECTDCPDLRTTYQNASTTLNQCLCKPGERGYRGTDCEACPIGTFKFSDQLCQICPENSVSPLRSNSEEACECLPGFELRDGSCQPCPIGSVKSFTGDSACSACPEGFTTVETGQTFCVCDVGYQDQDGSCVQCEPGTYNADVDDYCKPCADHLVSESPGSLSCEVCPTEPVRKYPFSSSKCEICPDDWSHWESPFNCGPCVPPQYFADNKCNSPPQDILLAVNIQLSENITIEQIREELANDLNVNVDNVRVTIDPETNIATVEVVVPSGYVDNVGNYSQIVTESVQKLDSESNVTEAVVGSLKPVQVSTEFVVRNGPQAANIGIDIEDPLVSTTIIKADNTIKATVVLDSVNPYEVSVSLGVDKPVRATIDIYLNSSEVLTEEEQTQIKNDLAAQLGIPVTDISIDDGVISISSPVANEAKVNELKSKALQHLSTDDSVTVVSSSSTATPNINIESIRNEIASQLQIPVDEVSVSVNVATGEVTVVAPTNSKTGNGVKDVVLNAAANNGVTVTASSETVQETLNRQDFRNSIAEELNISPSKVIMSVNETDGSITIEILEGSSTINNVNGFAEVVENTATTNGLITKNVEVGVEVLIDEDTLQQNIATDLQISIHDVKITVNQVTGEISVEVPVENSNDATQKTETITSVAESLNIQTTGTSVIITDNIDEDLIKQNIASETGVNVEELDVFINQTTGIVHVIVPLKQNETASDFVTVVSEGIRENTGIKVESVSSVDTQLNLDESDLQDEIASNLNVNPEDVSVTIDPVTGKITANISIPEGAVEAGDVYTDKIVDSIESVGGSEITPSVVNVTAFVELRLVVKFDLVGVVKQQDFDSSVGDALRTALVQYNAKVTTRTEIKQNIENTAVNRRLLSDTNVTEATVEIELSVSENEAEVVEQAVLAIVSSTVNNLYDVANSSSEVVESQQSTESNPFGVTCSSGFTLVDGVCTQISCPTGFYYDDFDGCTSCPNGLTTFINQHNTIPQDGPNYILGPRVANSDFVRCSNEVFATLELAKESCSSDSSCHWLMDYNCDGIKWRTCGSVTDRTVDGDDKACSLVKKQNT